MNTQNLTIMLRTTAPLHITSTESVRVDLEKAPKFARVGSGGGVPCTALRKFRYALPEARIDKDGRAWPTVDLPEIPANSLRGRLRRLAAKRIFDILKRKGERLSLDAYHALTCGAVTGQPGGALTLEDADQGREDPYFGAFGGGPRMLRSHFAIGTALPICSTTLEGGLIPDDVDKDASFAGSEYDMTVVVPTIRKDDALLFTDASTPELIEDYHASIREWIEVAGAALDEAPGDDGKVPEKAKKLSLRSFTALEYAIPGLVYAAGIRLRPSLNPAARGLLLVALADFIADGQIGGKGHNGFGRFDGSLYADGEQVLLDGDPNVDLPWVAEAMDAWAGAEEGITASGIEHIVRLEKPWRKKA